MTFSLEQYLSFIGIPSILADQLKPTILTLYLVVNKHVTRIPYQNARIFFKEPTPLDLDIHAITKRLFNNEGGMCYETSELLYYGLQALGFDARRIPAFPLNNKPFDPQMPSTHNTTVISVENRLFVADVGYGYNSLRYPLELNLGPSMETTLFEGETYQLLEGSDYYQINIWQDNNWFSLYRFNKPLKYIDHQGTVENYHRLLDYNGCVPIRDLYLKSGIVTNTGRSCFHFEPRKDSSLYAFQTKITFGKESTQTYSQPSVFKKDLESRLKIQLHPQPSTALVKVGQENKLTTCRSFSTFRNIKSFGTIALTTGIRLLGSRRL